MQRNKVLALGGVVTGVLAVSAAALGHGSAPARQAAYPNAIVALGHSGVTGYNSDPSRPRMDATANSWITGTNPRVNSLYLRILARNPGIKGNNVNLGEDGSKVDALVRQAGEAVALKPAPGLVVIQTVDNDMRCDGTDTENYKPFGATLARALGIIAKALPAARILIVSSPWSTVRQYNSAMLKKAGGREALEGTGPCDSFDPSGKPVPAHWAYMQKVTNGYFAVLAATCRRFVACRYDRGALGHLGIGPADITPDFDHMSVQGMHKAAALEWPFVR
jgi:hypothetical protein